MAVLSLQFESVFADFIQKASVAVFQSNSIFVSEPNEWWPPGINFLFRIVKKIQVNVEDRSPQVPEVLKRQAKWLISCTLKSWKTLIGSCSRGSTSMGAQNRQCCRKTYFNWKKKVKKNKLSKACNTFENEIGHL